MKNKLTVVENAKYAPRPHHGLLRALYDTVEACGGANIKQIKEYLPAAIDNITQVLRKGRLNRGLYHAVYKGYLIFDPRKKYWTIAPRNYYDIRQAHCDQLAENRAYRGEKLSKNEMGEPAHNVAIGPIAYYTIHISKALLIWAAAIAAAAAAFAAGKLL